MTMEFIFRDSKAADKAHLLQGDILENSQGLRAILKSGYPAIADDEDCTHLMVLTQSCDLVRRDGRNCKSDHITLAVGRSWQSFVVKFVARYCRDEIPGCPLRFVEADRRRLLEQELERLLHHTLEGLFLITQDSHARLPESIIFELAAAVTLKVQDYDALKDSRIAQLKDIFQAKVGWLAGNLYSRIGTPDLEEHHNNVDAIKKGFFKDALAMSDAVPVGSLQYGKIREAASALVKAGPTALTAENWRAKVEEVAPEIELLADRIVAALRKGGHLVDANPPSSPIPAVVNALRTGARRLAG